MVWTKDEVDKYVIQVERNCKSAHERNLKGFAFARLYREAADNESAKRYLEAYISESEGDFRGHCLMGQLYESMGQLEKAVASYRRSLELNNTQKELVLKVVKLYCQVPVHPDRARAWADRGSRLFPGHPDVFHLRLHLLESADIVDYEALEDLISEELSKRPRDVDLHVRLVRLYAVRGRLDEAFSHCVAVWKTKAFKDSLEWVTCCVDMFEKYLASLEKAIKGEVIGSGNAILDVHSFLLIALCQFVELQLHDCSTREVISALYRLDHSLFMAHRHKIRQSPRRSTSGGPTEWEVILTEMKAQLYMLCGTLLIRLAKEKYVTWPRGLKLACTCYLASISISEPETKTPWVARAPKNKDPLKWYVMACSRLSQVGHFLAATRDRHGAGWIDTCHSDCCSPQGLQEVLHTVYRGERDLTKSFLACDDEFSVTELAIPSVEQLVSWDEVAVSENPRSLQNIIWVGLHWFLYDKEMRPGVGVMVKDIFHELRLDVPDIEKHITPNMLCLRDIEAFVYAVVRTTAARVLEDRDIFYEDYEPRILPQPLCSSLSLPVQDEWWIAAYNLYTGKFSLNESGKLRRIVQLGIEKIRAVDDRHGLQVQLLIYLGNSFGSKASFLKSSGENPWYYEEHWKSLEKWSMHYLRKALTVLEKVEKDESIPHCEKPLFPHMFESLQLHELKSQLQSVRLAMGGALMKEGKLFEAMEMFEQVKTPPGMYNLAQVYKYLAHVEACAATEETDTESVSPTKEYYQNLHEARSLLQAYLKMTSPSDVGRQAVMDELNDIETLIQTGFPRASSATGQRRDVRRRKYSAESRSSTNVSEVQESDDNFWVEQPQDPNTKDFIATLSEVALNKGYFQEQMALRDEAMSIRDETICSMREEINMLKKQVSLLQSVHYSLSTMSTPPTPSPGLADQSKPIFESTPVTVKQTSLSRSEKPLAAPNIKGPLKIDSSFFAGLSCSNSPEKRVEEREEKVASPTSPTSPGRMRHDSSTSYTEDIHFEPLIPLPEQIEVQTGEEDEEMMFSSRAKLYRYDKDVSAWKDRGIGTMKILRNSVKSRSRILMRREVVHKICANHFITAEMKLEEKKGTANSLIWSTLADYSEEILKPEQLAVKFKTQEEVLLFKEKFEECQKMLTKGATIQGNKADTSHKTSDILAKFAPEPGSWSCSVCLLFNKECTTVCVACGAAKLSEGTETSVTQESSKSGFQLPRETTTSSALQTGSPFVFEMSDTGTLSNSPFTFGVTSKSSAAPPPSFAFGAQSVAGSSETSASQMGTQVGSQVFGASEAPSTTKPATGQPFVLAAFGVPAISNKSSQSSFAFAASGLTGSSPFSFSLNEQTANAAPAEASVFGGGSPEQGGPALSFGSFGTGTSPKFDPDASNYSTPSYQIDSLKCEKSEGDDQVTPNVSTQYQFIQSHSLSSFSSTMPTQSTEIPEQKLFWQQPTGSFQFGQLATIPPLGGVIPGTENVDIWQQATPPIFKPPTSVNQGGFAPDFNVDFSSSELLRRLVAAKEQQDTMNQVLQTGGYDFTPYVAEETSEDIALQGVAKPLSSVKEYDNDVEESEESTDEGSSYSSTEEDDSDWDIEASLLAAQRPTVQSSQAQPSFSPSQAKALTTPVKPVPVHSTQADSSGPAHPSTNIALRRFLVAKSPLKGAKKQDEDCILVYEVRASIADREKANRLFLPPNFFNYTKQEACPGCIGCRGISKEVANVNKKVGKEHSAVDTTPSTKENISKPGTNTSASHVFGESATFGQLTFSSLKVEGDNAFSHAQRKDDQKPFQGAGMQLFSEPTKGAEGQDNDNLHFEPIIPLPAEIQVITGEEGLEVMFSERAKLYRFDVDSGQWKERGVGDVKLLRHPASGQGRVLMRREQIKKLCANHNITAGMELKPNVGSDRSWVWYTSADYADGEAKPEKLAIKFKNSEMAQKFKKVFDDLIEPLSSEPSPEVAKTEDQKEPGCKLYQEFMSTFAAAPGAWSCDVCYVDNKADDLTCVACNSVRPGAEVSYSPVKTEEETSTNASVVESVEPNTSQELNREAAPVSFLFQSPGAQGLSSSQLFTIGRVDPNEDTADDEIDVSPSKTSSPSKQGRTPPQKPSTSPSQSAQLTGPFGTGTPSKFTFSLVVSPGSPARKPISPISHASPQSPESPVHGDDEGPHFEPLIPLPEKVECLTGEEGQEVLFCERCKLFRYDGDTSQWKERGVGDIKILHNPNSGRHRILMRREQIFKLCANHVISADMELKPFPKSDRAWLWTTLSDFSEDVAKAETLAVRFRTNEIASQFKGAFDKAVQCSSSKTDDESVEKPEDTQHVQVIGQKAEEDITVVFEKRVTEDQKERAEKLQLPSNFFGYEDVATESNPDEPGVTTSVQDQGKPSESPEETTTTPSKAGFLFGSTSVASLSFQSVAASSLSDSPFGKKTPDKSPGFVGAGSQLFAPSKTDDGEEDAAERDHHDGPHFEPIIPLPDKIDVKTGEEDEEVMFSHRAKLYRFVAEERQWKERGVGDIKLLRNNQTGKMRVLMRREQVLKLCANHQITTDMKLQPNAGSERSWVWSTPADFSEQECKAERLAVRFKNEEIAKQFKEKFEGCQEILTNQASLKLPIQEEVGQKEDAKEDLLAKFKGAEGSWECDICMVRNDSDKVECAACGSPKPGVEPTRNQKTDEKPLLSFGSGAASSGSGFTFGSSVPSSGTGLTFGSVPPSSSSGISSGSGGAGFSFGSSGTTEGDAKPVFTFGSAKEGGNATDTQTVENKEDAPQSDEQTPDEEVEQPWRGKEVGDATNEACDATGETQTGDRRKEETTPANKSEASLSDNQGKDDIAARKEEKFLFGSPNISSLSFHSLATSSSWSNSPFGQKDATKSPSGFAGAGSTLFASQSPGGDEHEADHEGDHDGPHFEPIIPLPDKIDVKTGEEDEEVMFSHRAKLYRFAAEEKQWKERGVGDIKLLRSNQTGKMRVLMRREQVLKLCANHQITTDMKLQPNAGSDRSWVWSTPADFSEQECKAERLAVRFKSEDIAKQFKEKFEECQEILKNQASLKLPIQEQAGQKEDVKEDILAKFKAAEGSWECDICMVRNDSDKVECAACGSPKPGVEPTQNQKTGEKPLFSFGSGAAPSGTGFTFGSSDGSPASGAFLFGSGATSSSSGISFGTGGTGVLFGSSGTTEGDVKPVFSFGVSSGSSFAFGALKQGENKTGAQHEVDKNGDQTPSDELDGRKGDDQQIVDESGGAIDVVHGSNKERTPVKPVQHEDEEGVEDGVEKDLLEKWKPKEGSWECDICLVRNNSDDVECAVCGRPKPGVELSEAQTKDEKPSGSSFVTSGSDFLFGSGGPSVSSSGSGFTFGSDSLSSGSGFTSGLSRTSDSGESPFLSFGSQALQPSSGSVNVMFGTLNQTSSFITDTKETAQSESETPSVDKEEKPLLVQGGEKEAKSVQQSEREVGDAAGKEETEKEVVPKSDETTDESRPEERVSQSSEKQHDQNIPGVGGTDENESKDAEDLKHSADSQQDGGVHSASGELQDAGNNSSASQPKEEA